MLTFGGAPTNTSSTRVDISSLPKAFTQSSKQAVDQPEPAASGDHLDLKSKEVREVVREVPVLEKKKYTSSKWWGGAAAIFQSGHIPIFVLHTLGKMNPTIGDRLLNIVGSTAWGFTGAFIGTTLDTFRHNRKVKLEKAQRRQQAETSA